jgi:hypothetical protein
MRSLRGLYKSVFGHEPPPPEPTPKFTSYPGLFVPVWSDHDTPLTFMNAALGEDHSLREWPSSPDRTWLTCTCSLQVVRPHSEFAYALVDMLAMHADHTINIHA